MMKASGEEVFSFDIYIFLTIIVLSTDAWGDIITNIEPQHLSKIGINYGDHFRVELGGKRFDERGQEFKCLYGSNAFLSVDQGQWFAFDEARGFISISANGYARVHKVTDQAKVNKGGLVHILRPIGKGASLAGIPWPQEAAFATIANTLRSPRPIGGLSS
jgi:hypothetical protein